VHHASITHRSCPEKSSKSQDQLRVARLRWTLHNYVKKIT
jgi:hypothetical protein